MYRLFRNSSKQELLKTKLVSAAINFGLEAKLASRLFCEEPIHSYRCSSVQSCLTSHAMSEHGGHC